MLYVDNENITDPRLNLAIEEHLLRDLDLEEPILLLYINEPSVIVGRNQNTIEEIDPGYIKAQGIHVVRRLSGGGAVYHDLGNLNFSFITQGKRELHNFAKITDPVIQVLKDLGLDAELKGKSDIFAAGKKISGNAQYATGGRMFSHGTLLFDSDLKALLKALNPRRIEIESKAVQSVRNLVVNIRELLAEDMTIDDLKQAILSGIFGGGKAITHPLTPADWRQIHHISSERYQQWDWNYGRSPRFKVRRRSTFPLGHIEVRIEVKGGRIEAIRFSGDFTGSRDTAELERRLLGIRYESRALAQALEEVELRYYFDQLDKDTFLNLLLVW